MYNVWFGLFSVALASCSVQNSKESLGRKMVKLFHTPWKAEESDCFKVFSGKMCAFDATISLHEIAQTY